MIIYTHTMEYVLSDMWVIVDNVVEKIDKWQDIDLLIDNVSIYDKDDLKLWIRSIRFNYTGNIYLTMRRLPTNGYQIQISKHNCNKI